MDQNDKNYRLYAAGFTEEQIALCEQRYNECTHPFSYEDWVTGYIMLNTTQPLTPGALLGQSLVEDAKEGRLRQVRRVKRGFKLGSYRYKNR